MQAIEQCVDAAPDFAGRSAPPAWAEGKLVVHPLREELVLGILEHHANSVGEFRGRPAMRWSSGIATSQLPGGSHNPSGWGHEPSQHRGQGGLA
jgi:hypothetical protein